MSNDQMKPNRFLRIHSARVKFAAITGHISRGGRVQVATCTRATVYSGAEWFRVAGHSVYVRRGKSWDCIDYCAVRMV